MPATISDIASRASVSHSTVSRLINGDPRLRISKQRRAKILELIAQHGGCRPHQTARALVSRRTGVVQWPLSRDQDWSLTADSYVGHVLMGAAEETVRNHGRHLAVVFYSESSKHDELPPLISQPGFSDGALFAWGVVDDQLARFLRGHRIPHVVLDPDAETLGVHMTVADEETGIRAAVDHLVSLGHRRIGWAGRMPAMPRFRIFQACLVRHGLALDERNVATMPLDTCAPGWDVASRALGESAMAQLLDGGDITAVCCDMDGLAFGAIDALKARGLTPGRDMSIIGYDDLERWGWRPFGTPMLSTVHNPLDLIGRRAAEALFRQIDDGWSEPETVRIPTRFIARESTGPVAAGAGPRRRRNRALPT